eukprot:jgi/Botrbrau1/23251/Bobra.0579s0001.1
MIAQATQTTWSHDMAYACHETTGTQTSSSHDRQPQVFPMMMAWHQSAEWQRGTSHCQEHGLITGSRWLQEEHLIKK